ncbi:MAG: amidase family protein [Gemmatimonadota bacterium]|nr:amidase family protein [Gemmatimonadota bacterium]
MAISGDFFDLLGQEISRRRFTAYFSSVGLASTLLPGILWAKVQETDQPINKAVIREAEKMAGLEFTDEEREMMVEDLNEQAEAFETMRSIPLDNSVPPALHFSPILPGMTFSTEKRPMRMSEAAVPEAPSNIEEVAFWPVTRLSPLIRSGQVSSVNLTTMYLNRLKKYGPRLECTITLTEELAMKQARRADEELAKGSYRGPLHGIPWGAKDLLATRGYKTTWGAMPYKDQSIDLDATVVQKLDKAGAVLIGKLTLGALAMGDVWYGGKTKNPWNPEEGSSGSSAGPGAATAAGLVGFSIGTETLGSIVSPSTRNGVTGLRPTYGRVSRYGAMALSWSMDKIGSMCRSVEDCALVFDAIHGPDDQDATLVDLPFNWDAQRDISKLRIGYYKSAFEAKRENNVVWKKNDDASLALLQDMGLNLIPIELPDGIDLRSIRFVLGVEAAAAFDELTRNNRDDLLVRQNKGAWPNTFRKARMIPAVEFIQANRVRTLVMQQMAEVMEQIDVFVTPSYGGNNLLLTNLTGHPAVCLPNGFKETGSPTSISFVGQLYGEADMLAVARVYQEATDFHLQHPVLER